MSEREPITTSELSTHCACARRYYLKYVLLLAPSVKSEALRFGSAWHTLMENRWHGKSFSDSLGLALTSAGEEIDALAAAQLYGMASGYYARYGEAYDAEGDAFVQPTIDPTVRELYSEVPFRYPLRGSKTFDAAGKIDGLGVTHGGEYVLVEHKSSGEDIAPDSDYWMRLRHNAQLFQYVCAARKHGWNITRIIYDVSRKPMLKPYADKPTLDADGMKVVMYNGVRVVKADGTFKQTATKDGEVVLSAPETMDEYAERVAIDARTRPEWYFARREVPILEHEVEEFETQRLAVTKILLMQRALARKCAKPEHAYPRNVGGMVCKFCDMRVLCLGGYSLTAESFAACGLRVRSDKHEELVEVTE